MVNILPIVLIIEGGPCPKLFIAQTAKFTDGNEEQRESTSTAQFGSRQGLAMRSDLMMPGPEGEKKETL